MTENTNGNNSDDKVFEELKELVTFKRAGRKTKCNPQLIELLSRLIAHGLSTRDACSIVEIETNSYYRWLNRGKKELARLDALPDDWIDKDLDPTEQIYLLFYSTIKKAVPARKLSLIQDIRNAQSWQSKAWLLERLHPEEFAKRTIVKVDTWQTEVLNLIQENVLTFEQLETELGSDSARDLFERAGKRIPEKAQG